MFLVFGKCLFLLRWKNVLSVSHPLHLRFSWNKSVTSTVISVNRPFIIRVATVRERSLENEIFSRSWKSQGISILVREI